MLKQTWIRICTARAGAFLLVLTAAAAWIAPVAGEAYSPAGGLPTILEECFKMTPPGVRPDSLEAAVWRENLTVALAGGANPELLAAILHRAQPAGMGPAELGVVLDRARHLGEQRLPIDPLLDRFLQGIAKNAPFARILAVTDSIEADMLTVAGMVDDLYPPGTITTPLGDRLELVEYGAGALGLGGPPAILYQALSLSSASEAPIRAACAPLAALECLLSAGLSPPQSLDIVSTAWRHGYRGEILKTLGQILGAIGGPANPPAAEIVEGVLAHLRDGAESALLLEELSAIYQREEILREPLPITTSRRTEEGGSLPMPER